MKEFNKAIHAQFEKMCKTGKLFRANISGDELWTLYLKGFGVDPVFRDPNSSEHNCNLCKNFIRRYGNIVAIDDNMEIMTLFNVQTTDEYQRSADAMAFEIAESGVRDVFFETYDSLNSLPYEKTKKTQEVFRLGIAQNYKKYTEEEVKKFGVVNSYDVYTFDHFHLDLPKKFVDMSGKSIERIMANYRDDKNVFKRAMEEISTDTLALVIDLIKQGSLLDGATHLSKAEAIYKLSLEYNNTHASARDNWCWETSYGYGLAKFKNSLIGVLCSELSEGKDLNKACKDWNYRVDPANYMKAVAPITETQKKNAQKFVEENGYIESFDRRPAVLNDIKADEIRHMNVGDGEVKSGSIFDNVKPTKSRHKRNEFKEVQEVDVNTFLKDILPSCTSVEAYFENRHENNLVTLTTSKNEDCKPMFGWTNPYSWTYKGNLAGVSQIKQAVKDAGGNVEGVLNFRLAWNQDGSDESDLDAWAQEPNGTSIGYNSGYRKDSGNRRTSMSGQLDVDNTDPNGKLAVENITWTDISKMRNGVYKLWVHQFHARRSKGFKAEIEFDGEIYEYTYDKPVKGYVQVAEVTLKDGQFSIKHLLPCTTSSKEIYGIETKNFHKVNLVCLSPNHWGDNQVGNKHYFFMLENCKFDTPIRSFHNENLNSELKEHRKVLEVLGAVNMLEPTNRQLSGLGFNATVKDDIILRLKGNFNRVIKLKF